MKESLVETLYNLVRAEQFVPFSILFASGQRFEIKSREHIGIGPVSRSDFEKLKAVIVWDDEGQWRSVYIPAILQIEGSQDRATGFERKINAPITKDIADLRAALDALGATFQTKKDTPNET